LIEISFLGSGSSGNCAVVRCDGTAVLLDSGLSMRDTKNRLAQRGVALEEIRAIFLTHEHADHVRSAFTIGEKYGLPIYCTSGTSTAAGFPGPLFADVRIVKGGREVRVGDGSLTVRVTSTPHDGAESVCYVFADGDGRRVGVATDLGHISRDVADALSDCDVLGLEANHDTDLLRAGTYPFYLKKRILSDVGHLSNDAAAAGLLELIGPSTKALAVLHVSKHNNTPALAAGAFRLALDRLGVDVPLEVAPPGEPTEWRRA
jgi:phosphoribosyl 1,2-cyclic phosphodiesterase